MSQNKSVVLDYSFIPRNPETARLVMEDCQNNPAWRLGTAPQTAVFAAEKTGADPERVTIYKDKKEGNKCQLGAIHFWGKHNHGAYYRKLDMKMDNQNIVPNKKDLPTCSSLNFDYSVVGSDEVGTGERFKQIIVTAAYVAPEDMDQLLLLNVKDSKQISKNQLRQIGAKLSGISETLAKELFDRGDETITSLQGCVRFQSRILSNQKYDEFQRRVDGTDKNDLLSDLHAEVLNSLIREWEPDYVVVDDFMETDAKVRQDFCRSLESAEEKIFLRTKADAINMAVSCASVISAYLSELYLDWLNDKMRKEYGLGKTFTIPAGNTSLEEMKKKLQAAGVNADEVIAKYAKTTFQTKQ